MATEADGKPGGLRTIKASEFKATCLKLMDEIAESGEEIVITKNGKPVAKLTPHDQLGKMPGIGTDRGKIKIIGDIVSPMPAEWFEDSDASGESVF